MKTVFLLAIGIFLGATAVVAQNPKKNPEKDVEIIRFGEEPRKGKSKKPKVSKHIVKTAPFAFVMGYQPFFYEYRIGEAFTMQAGAGIIFKPSMYDVLDFAAGADCYDEDCPTYYDYKYRKIKPGLMLSLSPRFYFAGDAPEGGFIAPEIRTYFRRSTAEDVYLSEIPDEENYRLTDVMVHYGNQTLFPRMTVEWTVGAGIRMASGTFQKVYYEPLYYSESVKQSLGPYFRASVGLRIGFQL